ncbi:extracellular solute-binding protein [Streptomyces violens]|uniref:extracellular solute-binding protein n=1 Tax=Streptomyces violens TaxID=66377 RepID=UPI0004C2AFBA|nr:extracellular solute-binding protein [Streptomyces violens]
MKRVVVTAAAVLCLLAAGCSDPGPAPAGDGDIVLATGSDLSSTGVRRELIRQWERRSGKKVRIVKLPDTADGQRSQLLAAGQSGNSGYDVLNIDVAWTAEFAAAGIIRPWGRELGGDFLDSVKKTATTGSDGTVWAVPFNTDAGLLYFRSDLLRKYGYDGPPDTWEQLRTWSQQIMAEENAGRPADEKLYGMVAQLRPYEGLTVNTLESVWASGGDPERTAHLAGALQQGVYALKERLRTIMPQEATAMDETASGQWFAEGRALFMRNWPVEYASVAEKLEPGRQFDVAQLPAGSSEGRHRTVLGGQNLAIAADAAHPDEARSLITALTSARSEHCLLQRGFAATRASAYDGTAPACDLPPDDARREEDGGARPGTPPPGRVPPYTDLLHRALKDAAPRPRSAHYATYSKVVQLYVSAYLTGKDDASIADELAEEATKALSGRGERGR